jgi:hypothetical protein
MLGVDWNSKGERHMHDVRIVAGRPTEEELAAVTVVLVAAATRAEPTSVPALGSRWRTSARPAVPGRPAPGAWRAAALPRACCRPPGA